VLKRRLRSRGHRDDHDDLFSILLRWAVETIHEAETLDRLAEEMRSNRVKREALPPDESGFDSNSGWGQAP
jgi:hypothetical protein